MNTETHPSPVAKPATQTAPTICFNLANDPWIPAAELNGKDVLLSLHEVFARGHEIADLAVRPYERVSLMRLFSCIAHTALDGPKDEDDHESSNDRLPEAAAQYLVQWEESFELFHLEKPFLQMAGLQTNKRTPASKLDFALSTGNNSTLFDNAAGASAPRSFALERLSLTLLSYQCFSLGGTIGVGTIHEEATFGNGSSKDAPCSPSSALHAIIKEATLLGTILSNLLDYEQVSEHYGASLESILGRPVWENPPINFTEPEPKENAINTYLGRLVPMARSILLFDDCRFISLANGFTYQTFDEFPAEPTVSITLNQKQERYLLGFSQGKSFWRQLHALTIKRKVGSQGGSLALENLPEGIPFDLWVGALCRKDAIVQDCIESVVHVPAGMLTDNGRATFEVEVEKAEHGQRVLSSATKTYRAEFHSKENFPMPMASSYYWTGVEKNLYLLHQLIDASSAVAISVAKKLWREMLRSEALRAYELSCSTGGPRQLRAFAKGQATLLKGLYALKMDTEETSNNE
jgi:CRISPR system Cascade subunit CasA